MCDPVTLAIGGAIVGAGAGTMLPAVTAAAYAAGGAAVGYVGKKAMSAMDKAMSPGQAPQLPPPPEPPSVQAAAKGPTYGVGGTNGPNSTGFGFGTTGNTLLTGSSGAMVTPGMLGASTLLGA